MNLWGTYSGTVASAEDPLQLGRLRVRVPHVFGGISDQVLPWAMPAGMPASQKQDGGGMMWLPENGDRVWVRFLDGEPEKPVWEWGMQDVQGNKSYQFILYKKTPVATPSAASAALGHAGLPPPTQGNQGQQGQPPLKKSRLTRYGHLYEWNPFGMIASTSKGYAMVFTDASATPGFDGSLNIITERGYFMQLDDSSETLFDFARYYLGMFLEDYIAQAGSFYLKSVPLAGLVTTPSLKGITTFEASTVTSALYTHVLDGNKIVLGKFNLPPAVPATINPGVPVPPAPRPPPLPLDPIVRLSDLQNYSDRLSTWLDSLQIWLLTHAHTNGNLGGPTGPPVVLPPFPAIIEATNYLFAGNVPTGSPAVFAVKNAPTP